MAPARRDRRTGPNPPLTYIDDKDTNLLRKFISDRVRVRARRIAGTTARQQRATARAIRNAREMALLPHGTGAVRVGR
ncbi:MULTISPECIES: 30S ribosomal protein S18 [unclassified Kitasatospora]|uniref:30S ribosomal protein S18 n=1 Tax=unclassified Kitasatospora TaxID=2633591 RepID=UPI0036487559